MFEGNRLKITIGKSKQIWINLSIIESLSMRRLKIGEIIITPEKVIIPFKKDIKLIQPKQWLDYPQMDSGDLRCVKNVESFEIVISLLV